MSKKTIIAAVVFVLFCVVAFVGLGVFSEDKANEQAVAQNPLIPARQEPLPDISPYVGGFTGYILVSGKIIKLENGIDLSGKNIRHAIFGSGDIPSTEHQRDVLRDVDFSNSDLWWAYMREIKFVNCSFRGARLYKVDAYNTDFTDCDFADAFIDGCYALEFSKEQLSSTGSFKSKRIVGCHLRFGDLSGVDFSGFNLANSVVESELNGCNFTDAIITGTSWGSNLSKEQLCSTASFKNGELRDVSLVNIDFSETNLSKMDLSGCSFGRSNLHAADLTDSIISRCGFRFVENLTLEQIKSTWNYKSGRMAGIGLPNEIKKAIDAEKAE